MTREDKAVLIEELKEKFSNNGHFYITDASGLSVAEVNNFRGKCFDSGVEYRVIKNSLIRKALESLDGDFTPLNDTALKGFSGVLFSKEDAKAPAKLIKDFKKADKESRPKLKAASIEKDLFIGEQHLDMLISLKSKSELIGEVIGLLQSPAKNVIGALQSGQHKLAGIVKTLSEKES
ncbi:MAG: 50S ribosomal protein L10 [Imperialibacter sp.]|jgi:large subunit ribosomal protein L10|uniref:50S ribosomal protein L10 n=1 Tax=Imperialibacter sp. TaxID=2038411 RepID=UPI0030D8B6D7|tara:strand:+ start:864 stop:1397 length:534 start_codon:yes stop_codon:yes gene_type:complete